MPSVILNAIEMRPEESEAHTSVARIARALVRAIISVTMARRENTVDKWAVGAAVRHKQGVAGRSQPLPPAETLRPGRSAYMGCICIAGRRW